MRAERKPRTVTREQQAPSDPDDQVCGASKGEEDADEARRHEGHKSGDWSGEMSEIESQQDQKGRRKAKERKGRTEPGSKSFEIVLRLHGEESKTNEDGEGDEESLDDHRGLVESEGVKEDTISLSAQEGRGNEGDEPNNRSHSSRLKESEDPEDKEVERMLVDFPEEHTERSHRSNLNEEERKGGRREEMSFSFGEGRDRAR